MHFRVDEQALSLRKTLRAMALVHSSWTELAHRALRRSLQISSTTSLQCSLWNPLCGPWVRELSLNLYFSQEWPVDAIARLKYLLQNCMPNVRTLLIEDSLAPCKGFSALNFIRSDNLQRLQVNVHGLHSLVAICNALPNFTHLKQLSIFNDVQYIRWDVPLPNSPVQKPPASLVNIMVTSVDELPLKYADYILASAGHFIPKRLSLSLRVVSQNAVVVLNNILQPTFPKLEFLHLDFDELRMFGRPKVLPLTKELAQSWLSWCSSLKHLSLWRVYPEQISELPPTVETLELAEMNADGLDAASESLITNSPALKVLSVPMDVDERLKSFCAGRRVEISVRQGHV